MRDNGTVSTLSTTFQDEMGNGAQLNTGVNHEKCLRSGKNTMDFRTYASITIS